MPHPLHITSGDCAGGILEKSGIAGEVFVWHDVLYDGPRDPGWPTDSILVSRAEFLTDFTGGGLSQEGILATLRKQYRRLAEAKDTDIVLWFDACLFDMAMLVHLLTCLRVQGITRVELLCVDAFPGIDPYNGLGQLSPGQMASVYDRRRPVTDKQRCYAELVDLAFALQDQALFADLAGATDAPLPWVPAAVRRWLEELPDQDGLGRLERMALMAVRDGCDTPAKLFAKVAAMETPPQFWGDTTLWAKINGLATRNSALVKIVGPTPLLPQWEGQGDLTTYQILPR
jgi:hypothetical protein